MRYKWGKITKILVELVHDDQDESTPPSIIQKMNTPHTDEWKANAQMYDDIQKVSGEGSALDQEVAQIFLRDMELLQSELIEDPEYHGLSWLSASSCLGDLEFVL